MTRTGLRHGPTSVAALVSFAIVAAASGVAAQTSRSATASGSAPPPDGTVSGREAAKHFERGVALYGETDYRGALVEFKRAYSVAPNAAVLYNIGQSQFELQDYAAALTTFTRYIAESSSTDPRRGEVESTLEVLRTRVGHVSIVTDPPGADIAVDDVPVGKTPLAERVLVSVGARRITASKQGRVTVTRTVEVAADDVVPLSIELAIVGAEHAQAARIDTMLAEPAHTARHGGATLRAVGWTATGTLAAAAGAAGALAFFESNHLKSERAEFPVSSQRLSSDSRLTFAYSVAADALAAAALAVGAVTLVATLSAPKDQPPGRGSIAALTLGPAGTKLALTF